MATCPYCLKVVALHARKCPHCLSFIDKDAKPKDASDLAELVIKFVGYGVGLITILGTVAALLLAAFGYSSIKELNSSLQTLKTEIDKTKERSIELKNESDRAIQFSQARTINSEYEKFQNSVDTLILEGLEFESNEFRELDQIRETVKKLEPSEDNLKRKVDEIDTIVRAIRSYKDKNFEQALQLVSSIVLETIAKHRILCSAHSRLYIKYKFDQDRLKAHLSGLLECSATYARLSPRSYIALMMQAFARMRQAESLDGDSRRRKYEEAIEYFKISSGLAPTKSIVNYNLAACYTLIDKFDMALRQLERAKVKGEFATLDDLKYFNGDPDFDKLRADPKSAEKLAKILEADI